ncbi:MAG: tRNA pseudouridine(38-40) synthase TruA [Flavobacterium sp.]|nr:tRNA pseudouridine(38-40) synthase TruA [Flavobacterium sp.]
MRYFIKFAYKGTNYHGWQKQPNATSIQETLSKALSTILKIEIELLGAGRTDTGVHAKEMFAHFDYQSEIDVDYLIQKLNSFLPKDIAVHDFIKVQNDAHARFDATKRTYEYHINTKKNAFISDYSWYYHSVLNLELMNEACLILMKYTDFECFSKVNTDVNTFNCKIFEAYWKQSNDTIVFFITADRFLRNMVRAIVGTLINVGLEKISLQEFVSIIESKDRSKAGFSVPAHGLYLTQVAYDFIK